MSRFLKIFSILLIGVIVFVFGFLSTSFLNWYFPLSFLLILLLIFEIRWLSHLSFKSISFWSQVISPVLFLVAALLFFLLLATTLLWQNIFWLLVSFALILYLYNIWLFYGSPEKYQAFTLENFSWYLNLVTSFFAVSSFFGFIVFINLSIILSILFILVLSLLLFYQLWWIQKLEIKAFWFYGVLAVVIAIEIFLALRFLPFSFYVLAFWWTGVWYITERVLLGIARDSLQPGKIIRLSIAVFVLALILSTTTRWF